MKTKCNKKLKLSKEKLKRTTGGRIYHHHRQEDDGDEHGFQDDSDDTGNHEVKRQDAVILLGPIDIIRSITH